MADETQNPPPDPTGVDTQNPSTDPTGADTPLPDDDSSETPCLQGDENPEDHIGDEMKDPWDDQFQTDWPQNEVTSA